MTGKLFLIAAVAAGCALAQDEPPGGGGGGGGRGGGGGGGGMGMGGGMGAPSMSKFNIMATALNLDKDQKKADKALIEAGAKEAAPLREQIVAGRAKLATAIAGGSAQSEIDELIKAQALLMAQMSEIEGKTFQQIFAKLSPEQKQQGAARVFAMFKDLYMKKNWDEM